MVTTKNKSERTVAGAGYIISFFSDIEVLILNSSGYLNNIARLKFRYGKGFSAKTPIDEGDKVILGVIDLVKSSVFSTYVKFNALKSKVKEFNILDNKKPKKGEKIETIESLYKKIRDNPIPNVEDIENYVMLLNKLFVEAIDILQTAQGVYADAINPIGDPNA